MRKNFTNTLFFFAVTLMFIVTGCGSSGSPTASLGTNAAQTKVFGVALLGTTSTSTVTVKDSSVPSQEKTAALSSDGSYTADVSGFKAPFILKALGTDETGGNLMLYSVSTNGGRANINQISDLAVAAAASMDTDAAGRQMDYAWSNNDDNQRTADNFDRVINSLRTVLAPLFELYQVSGSPVTCNNEGENSGLTALLHDVQFTVTSGNVLVTNRATGGIIFSGPLNNLASGTFLPENMPAGPGGTNTCAYTYSDWGTCQSDGTQTRTVLTSLPAGCSGGTPALSQSCTSPSTLTLAQVTASCTQCHGLTVNGIVLATGGYTVSGRTASAWVSAITGMGTTLAPGTTLQDYGNFLAGLSSTPSTCASFTYSAWGTCQSDSTQTRTVAASSPTGCTGGTPVLSQSCTYVPPVNACTSFTYSAWGACQSNNTQARTVATSSPASCTGGSPVLSQACVYVPPTPVCGSCHSIPPSTGKHTFHVSSKGYSCNTCHGTGYSSTTVNAATHNNSVNDVVSSLNFNATAGSCAPGCHGTKTW